MTHEIICDEDRSCRLDMDFNQTSQIPGDLIPLSRTSRSTPVSTKRGRPKQIKAGAKSKSLSIKPKAVVRGRPKNIDKKAKKPVKKVAISKSKPKSISKPKAPRGRPRKN